jgi:hypothetical protein
MECSTIRFLPPKIEGDTVHWTGEFTWAGGRAVSVYFDFTCPDAVSFTPRLRPFLLAFLIPAMRIGQPLQLDQPIDQTTLDNLMEWQEAMARWRPRQLKVVTIRGPIAPELSKPKAGPVGALTAFSGGVDSCFTAWRHSVAPESGSYRRTRLRAGMMVHGFDIPEMHAAVFESAFARSQETLASLGLAAYQIRTNLRSLESSFRCLWEEETHGIWLAAALAVLEPWFERVLIPSSYPYENLRLPWASNPVTDALFGSQATPFWHDGAAHDKLAKVRAFAQHAGIEKGIRVCWEGGQLDRNCGRCFKCISTQVCYWLCGVPRPVCFPETCQLEDVARTTLKNDQNRHLFRLLFLEARRQKATALKQALAAALKQNSRQRLWRKVRLACRRPQAFLDQL